jgi:hypothetical protein
LPAKVTADAGPVLEVSWSASVPSSMVSRAAAAPAEPASSMVRRRTGNDDLAVAGRASMADPWDGWLAGTGH